MRVATWNVNSIKVRADQVLAWAARHAPDVLCLQEIKTVDEGFPLARFAEAGYTGVLAGQKTYNGVAILAKGPLEDVRVGFDDGGEDDPQRRIIRATHRGVRVVNCYVPNGEDVGTEKYAYKLKWLPRLRAALDAQEKADRPLVLVGDMNVAPEPIDVHKPERWVGKVLFSEPERAALTHLRGFGLEDCVRKHLPDAGLFTWWDYRLKAWERNWGLRIDHVFATKPLAERSKSAEIHRDVRAQTQPSDHVPVVVDFDV
jgi:exodeoxyribonuclease-3